MKLFLIIFIFIPNSFAFAKTLTMRNSSSPLNLTGTLIGSTCTKNADEIVLHFTSINSNANCSITFAEDYIKEGENFCNLLNNDQFNSVTCGQYNGVFEIADIDLQYGGLRAESNNFQNNNGDLSFYPQKIVSKPPPPGVILPNLYTDLEYYPDDLRGASLSEVAIHCENKGKHLPTNRELVYLAQSFGANGFTQNKDKSSILLSSQNPDGTSEDFYYSNRFFPMNAGVSCSGLCSDLPTVISSSITSNKVVAYNSDESHPKRSKNYYINLLNGAFSDFDIGLSVLCFPGKVEKPKGICSDSDETCFAFEGAIKIKNKVMPVGTIEKSKKRYYSFDSSKPDYLHNTAYMPYYSPFKPLVQIVDPENLQVYLYDLSLKEIVMELGTVQASPILSSDGNAVGKAKFNFSDDLTVNMASKANVLFGCPTTKDEYLERLRAENITFMEITSKKSLRKIELLQHIDECTSKQYDKLFGELWGSQW